MMKRYFYCSSIQDFILENPKTILGELAKNNPFSLVTNQRDAWLAEISILKDALREYQGDIYFEYTIPRMGRRVDVVAIIRSVIFVLEFKVGSTTYETCDIDQAWDYALDLKNFHEGSHHHYVAPILIATKAESFFTSVSVTPHNDKSFFPIKCNESLLNDAINSVLMW